MKYASLLIMLIFSLSTVHSQTVSGADLKITKKTFVYKTVNKVAIKADLFKATDDNTLKPVIIWIHGGALIFGSRGWLPQEQMKLYVGAGYSVVSIDYRLAPETKLPEIIDDVQDAIKWVRLHGRDSLQIDSSRIFVIGQSGGAYLALTTGYLSKHPPKAIVSFYGYGDIQGDWYSKPDSFYLTAPLVDAAETRKLIYDSVITEGSFEKRSNIYLFSRQNGLWPSLVSGHDPVKDKHWFDRYCPIKNITSKYPPTLLIHGDKDTDVPFEQSVLMDHELAKKGVAHKFVRAAGYGHVFDISAGGLANPEVSRIFAEVIRFLNENR